MQIEKNFYKTAGIMTLLLFFTLIVWGIISSISIAEIEQYNSRREFVDFLTSSSLIYKLNYIIATALTFLTVAFFSSLYLDNKDKYPLLSLIGIMFVPIYAVLNIIIYSSQISIVPDIARHINLEGNALLDHWVFQMIQSTYGTIFSKINAFAYAILGIPSLCFAAAIRRKDRMGKIAALLLTTYALFCTFAFIGTGFDIKPLSVLLNVAFLIFVLSAFFVFLHYREQRKRG